MHKNEKQIYVSMSVQASQSIARERVYFEQVVWCVRCENNGMPPTLLPPDLERGGVADVVGVGGTVGPERLRRL